MDGNALGLPLQAPGGTRGRAAGCRGPDPAGPAGAQKSWDPNNRLPVCVPFSPVGSRLCSPLSWERPSHHEGTEAKRRCFWLRTLVTGEPDRRSVPGASVGAERGRLTRSRGAGDAEM